MSLAKVKPEHDEYLHEGKWINQVHMTLARYRHIWRVYRAAMAYCDVKKQCEEEGASYLEPMCAAQDVLTEACYAAKKAGVK